ncbi:glycosyltransferase [Sphaerochaeta pleomorpha str. Grapes]|uniref:Glycosyltransferase n=1 Tax=Sphaerochaeta pleomorpha (strain ATCC BAA-1885 / DSM 22778 / Grapes) TaxID=158190 RepID=G8QWV9_SPHPG|nr:glycosyltransferase family 4 protein [Sphaerochaeta pleomorpha]AEV29463.1 glycosyltransferase [Sphaerochaeta pleomorpha str. Grapes]
MKILRPTAYYEPEQFSSSHLDRDLEEAFIQAGFESIIVTPTPTRGIIKKVRNTYKKKKYEQKFDGKVVIFRVPIFKEGRNPVCRAWRYFLSSLKIYRKCIQQQNIDIILVGSTPPTQGVLAAKIAKKLKVPFIYNLQDIFPDSLVNAKMAKKGSLVWKIGRTIENYSYKQAEKIIVISEEFKKNIINKGVPEEKIELIYNWVDTKQVFPVTRSQNPLFDRYGLSREHFYVTYCGNIGHTQNLDLLLSVAKMCDSEPLISFILFGEGSYTEEFDRKIKTDNCNNVLRFPFQPYEDIANVFSLGDVGLIISKPHISQNSVPSKTWSIMAAARPVLASFDLGSTLDKVITENECGVVVEADNPDLLYSAILELFYSRNNLSQMGLNGRKFVMKELDKDLCVSKYIEVIKSVSSKR